jgi:CHAT domain-containing protein
MSTSSVRLAVACGAAAGLGLVQASPGSPSSGASDPETSRNASAPALDPGVPIERELPGGGVHGYRVRIGEGQFVRVVVDQRGIDVAVTLLGPDGREIMAIDSPNGAAGTEILSLVAARSGDHRLEIRSPDPKVSAGRYEVVLEEQRTATAPDHIRDDAQRAVARAHKLRLEGTAKSQRQAIEELERVLPRWREVGDAEQQVNALVLVGALSLGLGEGQKAVEACNQAVILGRALPRRHWEAVALYYLAMAHDRAGETRQGLPLLERALVLVRSLRDRYLEGDILNSLAVTYSNLGEPQRALDTYEQALTVARSFGDRGMEAAILHNAAKVHREFMHDMQRALVYENRSLALGRAVRDRGQEAVALEGIALVYDQLGDGKRGLDLYDEALGIFRVLGDRRLEAQMLYRVGGVHQSVGEREKALDYYGRGLALIRAVGDRRSEGRFLHSLGILYHELGQDDKALDLLQACLALRRSTDHRWGEAITLTALGQVWEARGEHEKALESYQGALRASRAVQARGIEASVLHGIAQVELARGNLTAARASVEAAIGMVESFRATTPTEDLRVSYSASVRSFYDTYIDVLMRLHQAHPSEGLAARALEVSERARARTLLDILSEGHAEVQEGVDPNLLARERSLQQSLRAKAERQVQLLGGKHSAEQAALLASEIRARNAEHQEVEAEIRRTSPRYAALMQPQPLHAAEVQGLLDQDTLLLEYALGDQRSYLWAVTATSITSHELPKRADLEAASQRVYDLLSARNDARGTPAERYARAAEADGRLTEEAAVLSNLLLAPVAGALSVKRLVIAAEGALQYVPFAALPAPVAAGSATGTRAAGPLLVVEHEIVSVPSAAVLQAVRRDAAGRPSPARTVAILADPVFDRQDSRVRRRAQGAAPRPADLQRALGDVGIFGSGGRIPRLPFTRQEAAAVTALAPGGATELALDFGANRAAATSSALGQHRIVHFATHGVLNNEHPELSGIVLSLVDEQGRPIDGFLSLHEIYNLRLPVDLVILSACQTALGKLVRGEGLVGLTRGFMYAGASRVVSSLWAVDDVATARLMGLFHKGMLKEGLPPAEALRAAQRGLSAERRWSAPYYWAGFVLQGEWK